MNFEWKIRAKDKTSRARCGVLKTPHGEVHTPAFIPVGTKATVKTLTPDDLLKAGSQAVLANTYHLYLSPGPDVIGSFGGFGPFMNWSGPTFTDSGGYQVSFLWNPDKGITDRSSHVKITDEGALFRSHIDGSKHLITPEKSMEIQDLLGADIIMAFDQPLSQSSSRERQKEAFYRTLKWEERSIARWSELQKYRDNFQALYGVIQGETDIEMRKESLSFLQEHGFPGLAMGGASIGSDPQVTAQALDTIAEFLPDNKPLHALGLGGGVEGILEAVSRGVDTFDNTSVTRMARTGQIFAYPEDGGTRKNRFRLDVRKFRPDSVDPISRKCHCESCTLYKRGYIRHLVVNDEILGGRLASVHNIHFMNSLMADIRRAIETNDLLALREYWLNK